MPVLINPNPHTVHFQSPAGLELSVEPITRQPHAVNSNLVFKLSVEDKDMPHYQGLVDRKVLMLLDDIEQKSVQQAVDPRSVLPEKKDDKPLDADVRKTPEKVEETTPEEPEEEDEADEEEDEAPLASIETYTKKELMLFAEEAGLDETGTKSEVFDRLVDAGVFRTE